MLEVESILASLVRRAENVEIIAEPERVLNNAARGLQSLRLQVRARV